jgi:hypothetical protein
MWTELTKTGSNSRIRERHSHSDYAVERNRNVKLRKILGSEISSPLFHITDD